MSPYAVIHVTALINLSPSVIIPPTRLGSRQSLAMRVVSEWSFLDLHFREMTPMWNTSGSNILINALIVVLLASCTSYTYEVVRPPDNGFQSLLEPGDTVRIVINDGRELEFTIEAVTSEEIGGNGQRVLFSDIAILEKRELDDTQEDGATTSTVLAWLFLEVIVGLLLIIPFL